MLRIGFISMFSFFRHSKLYAISAGKWILIVILIKLRFQSETSDASFALILSCKGVLEITFNNKDDCSKEKRKKLSKCLFNQHFWSDLWFLNYAKIKKLNSLIKEKFFWLFYRQLFCIVNYVRLTIIAVESL